MTTDPLRRRYGRGAARLRIGHLDEGISLARVSSAAIPFEHPFAATPGLACAVVAVLLLWAAQRHSLTSAFDTLPLDLAERPAPLQLQLWDQAPAGSPVTADTTTVVTAPVAVEVAGEVDAASKAVGEVLDEAMGEPAASSNAASDEVTAQAPFDPRLLALAAPTAAPRAAGSEAGPRVAASVTPRSERPGSSASVAAPATLALASPDAAPTALIAAGTAARAEDAARLVGSPRPSSGSTRGSAPPEAAHAWLASNARRDFLASIPSEEALAAPVAPSTAAARPPVAAALARPDLAESLRAELGADAGFAGGDGWQEVPLDELPDCSPPGRQDALKRRIVAAAPFQRECSHREGRYRFVERRNLNAFLMWSRPNPDAPASRRRDRDACEVLERALRCLEERSTEESSAR